MQHHKMGKRVDCTMKQGLENTRILYPSDYTILLCRIFSNYKNVVFLQHNNMFSIHSDIAYQVIPFAL